MIFGTKNSIQLARFRAVALAEDTLHCKAKQRRRWSSVKSETDVADGFGAEALFWFCAGFRPLRFVRARSATGCNPQLCRTLSRHGACADRKAIDSFRFSTQCTWPRTAAFPSNSHTNRVSICRWHAPEKNNTTA